MLIRILIFLIIFSMVIGVIKWFAKRALRKWLHSKVAQPQEITSEKLVQCYECQTFIPISRSKQSKNGFFCAEGHLKAKQT